MSNIQPETITDKISMFLSNYGFSGTLIIIIILLLKIAGSNPENFKIYFGFLWQIIAGPFKYFRKRAIRFQIEGPLTKSLKRISKELPDLEIPELQINWVKSDELATKLLEGKAIIKLKFDNDNSKNIIKATSMYVKDAFLVNSKPYLSENLTKAIDLTITKKILLNAEIKNKGNVIPQFINENRNENSEVFEKCEKIEEIDDNGLFTRVIIKELNYLGERYFGRTPRLEHKNESDEFLNFVHNLVVREYDDNTPLVFNKNVFKVGFLLVAKSETYITYGLEAYYRRIRLSLAEGVKTFYLLARQEKVEILEKVANELIQTGNFILKAAPKEYIDNLNRKCICYSIDVNSDSILATTLAQIGKAIQDKTTISGVITSVRESRLLIDINGISGEVKHHNLSAGEITDARSYFREKSDIELLPLEILEGGHVNFTLKNTKSDPLNFVKSQFEIGKQILAKVIYIDDNFIKLDIGNEIIEGIAFRKDLTYSKYIFLHDKFQLEHKYNFIIKDYDFSKGRLVLQLEDLKNPWEDRKFRKNETVNFTLMRKTKNSFVGEIEEGIEALIPKYELGWTDDEQEENFKKFHLNSTLDCVITNIEENILILSSKKKIVNPYEEFFKNNKSKIIKFRVLSINDYGINGKVDDLEIYVPKYEISWNGNTFNYSLNKKYDVYIKDIGKNSDKLIGSFKPLLKHPLEDFSRKFKSGSVLKNLKIKQVFDWGIVYNITFKKRTLDGLLPKKNISNECFINDVNTLAKVLENIPIMISEINLDQNKIILSFKDLLNANLNRLQQLDYSKEYQAVVIGYKNKNAIVFLTNLWVEGILESSKTYDINSKINIRPSKIEEKRVFFTDD